jgi:hypothetical protein
MSGKHKTGPAKTKPFRAAGDDLEDNVKIERIVHDDVASSDSESEIAPKPFAGAGAGAKKQTDTKAAAPLAVGQKRKRSEFEKTEAISAGSAESQAAAFWAAFTGSKTGEKLSDLEITSPLKAENVIYVPPSVATTAGTASNDVSDVAATVKVALPEWKRIFGWKAGAKKRDSGCPEVLLITFAAPRAASMLKPLAVFNTRVAKLFAKHLTVEDQTEILKGPPVTIGIGALNPAAYV